MQLTPPTKMVFWISVILVVAAVLAQLGILLGALSGYAFWIAVVGYVLLALGNAMKGF